jgi:hypothetical protein
LEVEGERVVSVTAREGMCMLGAPLRDACGLLDANERRDGALQLPEAIVDGADAYEDLVFVVLQHRCHEARRVPEHTEAGDAHPCGDEMGGAFGGDAVEKLDHQAVAMEHRKSMESLAVIVGTRSAER